MQKVKIPIIILLLLILSFVGYNFFIKKSDGNTEESLSKSNVSPNNVDVKAEYRELVNLVALMRRVNFKDKFSFSDPVFRSLVDFSQKIEAEEKGRENPFGGELQGLAASAVEQLGFEEESGVTPSQTNLPSTQTPSKSVTK